MQKEQILQANLLDIIFDNRNKAYGAYQLRLQYPSKLKKAITLTLFMAILFALIASLYKPIRAYEYIIPMDGPTLASPPEFPEKEKIVQTSRASGARIVTQNAISSRLEFTEDTARLQPANSSPGTIIPGAGIDSATVTVPPGPPQPPTHPVEPAVDKNVPLVSADVMPAFPGGMNALHKFLEKNLRDPAALQEGETRSVAIRFVVGYDGVLRSFQTIQDGGEIYNNEVMRVLKKMPSWIPGKSKGEEVSVYFILPVKFTASE